MAIIDIKCKHCGMNVETDEDHDHGVCPYCGTEYIIDVDDNEDTEADDYEYESLIIEKNELPNIKRILGAFKYKYVSQLIHTENKIHVTFKRPNKFPKKSKIIALEQEYNKLDTDIYHLQQAHHETDFIEGQTICAFLLPGLILLISGLYCLIAFDDTVFLSLFIIGLVFTTIGSILISINVKRKVKIKEFYEKIEAQIKDNQKRMNEIVEEAEKIK